jgi:hypothetical protein
VCVALFQSVIFEPHWGSAATPSPNKTLVGSTDHLQNYQMVTEKMPLDPLSKAVRVVAGSARCQPKTENTGRVCGRRSTPGDE